MDLKPLFCLLLVTVQVYSYPQGPPVWRCEDGYPGHGDIVAQYGTPPYSVLASTTRYVPQQQVSISLRGIGGARVTGFVLRVQQVTGNTEQLVGSFLESDLPPLARGLRYYSYRPGLINCVGHSELLNKDELTFTWIAPDVSVGDVRVRVTVVRNYRTFWTNVELVIKAVNSSNPDLGLSTLINNRFEDFNLESCGTTKGCAMFPNNCKVSNCRSLVTWQPVGGAGVKFEAVAETDGYVSVGFSDDKFMGDDVTMTCVATSDDPPVLNVQLGYNPDGQNNERHPDSNFTDVQVRWTDGHVQCSFVRPVSTTFYTYKYSGYGGQTRSIYNDLASDEYYLFVASGDVYPVSSTIRKHSALPLISENKLNFVTDMKKINFNAVPGYLKFHGLVNMISWSGLVAMAIIFARHYKHAMEASCLGTVIWYQLHRITMLSAVILSSLAGVVVMVEIKGFTKSSKVHAAFGIIVLVAAIVQMICGLCQSHGKNSKRGIMHTIHRISGVIILITAVITTILGLVSSLIDSSVACHIGIIFAIWCVFVIIWELILEINKYITHNDPTKMSSNTLLQILMILFLIATVSYAIVLIIVMVTEA